MSKANLLFPDGCRLFPFCLFLALIVVIAYIDIAAIMTSRMKHPTAGIAVSSSSRLKITAVSMIETIGVIMKAIITFEKYHSFFSFFVFIYLHIVCAFIICIFIKKSIIFSFLISHNILFSYPNNLLSYFHFCLVVNFHFLFLKKLFVLNDLLKVNQKLYNQFIFQ